MKLKIVRKTEIINIVGWIIMFCLIYMKYVLQINLPRELLLLVFTAMAFFSNKEELIGLCICCIPLSTVFHYYYAIIICIFIYIMKYYTHIHLNNSICIVFLLWIWELAHCFGEGFSINKSITFIFSYVLTYLLMFSNRNDIRYEKIVRIFSVCVSFMCVAMLCKLFLDSGGNLDGIFRGMQRLGQNRGEEIGVYFNPNTLGFFCIISSCGLIQLVLTKQSKRSDIIMSIYLIMCGFLTTSKTFVVCLVIMFILFGLAVRGAVVDKIKFLFYLLLFVLGALLVINRFFPNVLQNYLIRFSVKDISSGRITLFAQYNTYIVSSVKTLLWGTGLSAHNIEIDRYFGITNCQVPHNGFQEILVVWGIPGMILLFAFLASIIVHSKKILKRQEFMNYIPLILLLIKVQAGQLVTLFSTMLMFPLIYLSLCFDFKHTKELENNDNMHLSLEKLNNR